MKLKLPRVLAAALAPFVVASCSYLPKDEGEAMKKQIAEMQAKFDRETLSLRKDGEAKDVELKRLRGQLDEATSVVKRNSADVVGNVQKLQTDFASLTGRVDDLQNTVGSLNKSFTDYRATSDRTLEQVVNATTSGKAPPIPENADGVFAEAQKRFDGKQFGDARRLFDAFINRYPADGRAAKAQFQIGETYLAEQKYANAIGAFTKVIDNFPKSEQAPDAMFRNGQAFYALKYCGDARIYFLELLKRYPKTTWKKDANDELKKIQSNMKNRAACNS